MLKRVRQSRRMHGLVFDGAVFLGNIVSVSFVPRIGDEVADATAGLILLLAVVTQAAGAWWKKRYLPRRLARRERLAPKGLAKGFMHTLLFLHFLLF